MCAQCVMEWPALRAAVGVELSSLRHAVGVEALERLEAPLRSKVRLVEGDMLATPSGFESATLVYVASLLFDDDFMSRLGARLAAMPGLRAVASLRPFPPDSLPGFRDDPVNFAADATVLADRVEVTWGAARVFMYRRQDEEDHGAREARS